jgi:hypothetical protein
MPAAKKAAPRRKVASAPKVEAVEPEPEKLTQGRYPERDGEYTDQSRSFVLTRSVDTSALESAICAAADITSAGLVVEGDTRVASESGPVVLWVLSPEPTDDQIEEAMNATDAYAGAVLQEAMAQAPTPEAALVAASRDLPDPGQVRHSTDATGVFGELATLANKAQDESYTADEIQKTLRLLLAPYKES